MLWMSCSCRPFWHQGLEIIICPFARWFHLSGKMKFKQSVPLRHSTDVLCFSICPMLLEYHWERLVDSRPIYILFWSPCGTSHLLPLHAKAEKFCVLDLSFTWRVSAAVPSAEKSIKSWKGDFSHEGLEMRPLFLGAG